ncbi:MAG: hypothetical protein RL755_2099, partial [Pseudomonadota bacterium]
MKTIKTTCPYCGVGCGIVAKVIDDYHHIIEIQGDSEHPANFGRLCTKGTNLADTVSLENRLLQPQVNGQVCDWKHATSQVATGFQNIIKEHGADAVAFYVSGQSAVVGYKRAFGADAVPCNYEDLEQAEVIILIGSNTAWCHPVAFSRIRRAKEQNPNLRIVVIDPRKTATCDIADLYLSIKPGMDALLFNGLLANLHLQRKLNQQYIRQYCEGFDDALNAALSEAADINFVAAQCGLSENDLQKFYSWFSDTEKVVSVYSQGINQSSTGSDKCNAIINCHLATGKIGRAGMGPFSFTGQPNAMGGREVGGLANMLAAHLELENPTHRDLVGRFWDS